jgi:hypothetical protein
MPEERNEDILYAIAYSGYLVDDYLKAQGRFSHLSPADLDRIQEEVDHD